MVRKQFVAFVVLLFVAISALAIEEEVVRVPVKIKDIWGKSIEQDVVVTIFRNSLINRPQPFMALNHVSKLLG